MSAGIRIEDVDIPIIRPEFGSGVDYGLISSFEWERGVRFHDASNGIVFDVVPGDGAMPRFYSEIAIYGALPMNPKPLSRRWLNARARLFLAQQDDPYKSDLQRRKTLRPDDATLVALILLAYEAGESPRQMLSREFWVSVNTVDDWIKRARAVAHEYGAEIPAPTRRRGHKRATDEITQDEDAGVSHVAAR